MKIGKTLKELRKAKKMTLSDLSSKSGVQIATLSRIEHDKMTGTLGSHMKIAAALNIDLPLLYTKSFGLLDGNKDNPQKNPLKMIKHNEKASYELLASDLSHKKMMPMLLKIEKDGRSSKEQFPFGAERFLFVIEGTIELRIMNPKAGKDKMGSYSLSKNGSLYFDASFQHFIINKMKSTAKIISVMSPVSL